MGRQGSEGLVAERNSWIELFDDGLEPHLLSTYRENRDSNLWRASRAVEQLCEYILWLEEKMLDNHPFGMV